MKHITKPMRAIHFMVLAFLMTIGSQVSAFDPADLQRLIDTKKCSKCYLTDTDLYRANLAGAIWLVLIWLVLIWLVLI